MSQVEPTQAGLTADEYWLRLAEFPHSELIDGEVVEVSPTILPHSRVEGRIFRRLADWADQVGAEAFVGEAGYQLGHRLVRGADVSLHLTPPDVRAEGWSEAVPDLVVEVVSPNDSWADVEAKASEWLAFGVQEVWLAEPRKCFVVVRRPNNGLEVFHRDSTLTTPLLPGFALDLAGIFR